MSRYLTPSKIGLLCLVYIYTEGLVPTSSTIPVLSFFISHLLPLKPTESKPGNTISESIHIIPIEEFQKALIGHASAQPGRTVWDLLVNKLWSIDCNDSLHEFFENLSPLVAKTREEQAQERQSGKEPEEGRMLLSRTSPMGSFVRRAQLEFTRLQFHDAITLWKSFIAFRLPTRGAWARRNASATREGIIDVNLQELEAETASALKAAVYGDLREPHKTGSISTNDVERLLEFQVGEMQSKFPNFLLKISRLTRTSGLGGRIPEEMRAKFRDMVDLRVTVPSLSYYVKYARSIPTLSSARITPICLY
jgi:anaphase-promoting complex subunit 5